MENEENKPTPTMAEQSVKSEINETIHETTKKWSFGKVVVIVLIIVVLFGFIGYFYNQQKPKTENVVETTPNETLPDNDITPEETDVPVVTEETTQETSTTDNEGWERYMGPGYSFEHDPELEPQMEAAGTGSESIRFTYVGPKQIASGRTQTSLFDGYFFMVNNVGLASEKSPEEWAEEAQNNTKMSCGDSAEFSDLETIQVGDGTGVRYTVRNCMGDNTTSFVTNGQNIYEVTQFYVGEPEDQPAYEEITDTMFESLKFW